MTAFDDILDGYFPLRISVADLMRRRKLRHSALTLSFAPIIEVDGLPHDAPVPLNIRSGRAGMIHHAELAVSLGPHGADLEGYATWHWLDGAPCADSLDPMTRLAEPALVRVRAQADAPRFETGKILSRIPDGRLATRRL